MAEEIQKKIKLPPSAKHPTGIELLLRGRVLVVVGANGSGKTRLGAWLEAQSIYLHHRISAHRSLAFPERVQPMDLKEAENRLLTGSDQKDNRAFQRNHHRWQQKPEIALLNDFTHLVTVLVSESFSVSDTYRVQMRSGAELTRPPSTMLDVAKEIWEAVLPARELVITGARIEARKRHDTKVYHAMQMSDGERGIFYLIAEALNVPKDGVFIADEPELHLHRAIQSRLWDAIEKARPDCTFVYITHDLGFAASRKDATKIWLREYTEGNWDWEEVPESDAFSEPMLLEMMGSRQPILFVEGDRASLDYFIYGLVYPEWCVIPCGSCQAVIHATRSFTSIEQVHHNVCQGLVDHDGRTTGDVEKLGKLAVNVLPVAEAENLFLIEPLLEIAAERLSHDPVEAVSKIQARVIERLKQHRVKVISNLTRQEMESKLALMGKGGDGPEALAQAFEAACAGINPTAIYGQWEAEIDRIIKEADYPSALRFYNNKGLGAEAGSVLGVRYYEQVMRWLRSNEAQPLVEALRRVLPTLSASRLASEA